MIQVASILVIALLEGCYATIQQCVAPKRGIQAKDVYRVGIYANRGVENAFKELHPTFGEFLSNTAGARFDPPIRFEATPVAVSGALDTIASGGIDFLFANPSIFSCMESEIGANSLLTLINQRTVDGTTYDLTRFGGVIFTRSNNTKINTIADIRDKRVGCLSLESLGAGLMQFQLLAKAGIHYMQDVKQLMFMKTQDNVVNGVLSGLVDVGFVRTDQLEQTIDDRTGELLDLSEIKVIGAQESLGNDGTPFPFKVSTPLFPERNFASLPHVSDDVAREVQASLLSLQEHAEVGSQLQICYDDTQCADLGANETLKCQQDCVAHQMENSAVSTRCDTTAELALSAFRALKTAKHAGWRSTLSYLELRDAQEDTGFIQFNKDLGKKVCARLSGIEDAVICPPGHFKKKDEEILSGCKHLGLPCHGFQCLCSPCTKGYEVDFLPQEGMIAAEAAGRGHLGCEKTQVCDTVEQMNSLVLVAIDNMKRPNVTFSVRLSSGKDSETYPMNPLDGFKYAWTLDATLRPVGVMIVEVFAGQDQIPESPFRVQVIPPDCEVLTGDALRAADASGRCVCQVGTTGIGSRCVRTSLLIPFILAPLLLIISISVYYYVEWKRKQADSVWTVEPDELKFENPPRILGRGSFGLVLLAEYRGTQVAIKRVLPPRKKTRSTSSGKTANTGNRDSGPGMADLAMSSQSAKTWKLSNFRNTRDGRESHFDFDKEDTQHEMPEHAPQDQEDDPELGYASSKGFMSSSSEAVSSKAVFGSSSAGFVLRSTSWALGARSSTMVKLRHDFIKEMRLVSKLRHPCITTVLGAVISPKYEPMLVMEKMEMGSLHDLLHNESFMLGGEIVLPILRDLSQGLRFLHSAVPQIVHGDLKAANVLVDARFHAKITDFGLSQKGLLSKSVCGTPLWLAPELLRGETSNTTASDVYAFGILLYEVFSRKDPYEGEDHKEVLLLVADKKVNKRPPVPPACPPEAAEMMKACLRSDPGERPTSEDIAVRLSMIESENIEPGTSISSLQNSKQRSETKRTEALLCQMFPKHIAEALRDGRKIEPEKHDCVNVYFSDIVGYTEISSELSPSKVSDLLDRLYTKFDNLCEKHRVFKIETVGDAYMATTNLELEQPDHALIMARFALDALQAASNTLIDVDDPDRGYVQIRCGFNTGPVVTHVVGSRNPRFSVIGDTVNTASRMESHSVPGRIQCSDSAARHLREQIKDAEDVRLKCRGEISIKGKGEMKTYWVQSTHRRTSSLEGVDEMMSSIRKEHTDSSEQEQQEGTEDQLPFGAIASRQTLLAPLYEYMQAANEEGEDEDTEEILCRSEAW